MFTTVLKALVPFVLWLIKQFVKKQNEKENALENYYTFLKKRELNTDKISKYMESEKSLTNLRIKIRDRELVEPERSELRRFRNYRVPKIVDVDIKVKTHGRYLTESGEAQGLIVHYTSGHSKKGRQNAVDNLQDLAFRGLGCMVMDINGVIYRAKSQPLDQIAWHAGESYWNGLDGISKVCMGMEICNAGLLKPAGETWFGDTVPLKEQRMIVKPRDNQKAGTYHKFTAAQEKSLADFCMWQFDVNPDFEFDWVLGHDEISPRRKQDPGASLSMTMPTFRDMLKRKEL